jgi:hypothetical protein
MALGERKLQKNNLAVELLHPCSTVAEHLTQNPEIEGLDHSGTGRKEIVKKSI